MRLSDILSKSPQLDFVPIDGFLMNKKGAIGQKVDLSVGKVALNYFCKECNDLRTFCSQGQLACIFVNKNLISIDCVVACTCGVTVQVWFLVESDNDITSLAPRVRILRRNEKLSDKVSLNTSQYGAMANLLDKAELAYRDELGAGALVYLRKIFEEITYQAANSVGVTVTKRNGKYRPFGDILKEVDIKKSIIPREFSANGYTLFSELSNMIHGNKFNEADALKKYQPLRRLIVGILDNIRNSTEFESAKIALGWN